MGTLERMLRSERVHHAMRFEGPDGVGKELTAMAFAQALVCTSGDPLGCGVCSACKRVVTMSPTRRKEDPEVPQHPDVTFVERGLYSPEMLGRTRKETQDISVDQIRRVVLERIAYPPHEGRARVFIIRRAEELSTSAANSLLKTLEEPGQRTHFVLLVSRPARMLSTIQSRTLKVRFAPLTDDVLSRLLQGQNVDPDLAARVVPLSAGSASLALELADPEASSRRVAFVKEALEAIDAPDATATMAAAEKLGRDRTVVRSLLGALATEIALRAKRAAMAQENAAPVLAERHAIVLRAIHELERNASLVLLFENMMLRLRAETG